MEEQNDEFYAERVAFEFTYINQCIENGCPELAKLSILGGSKYSRYSDPIEQALWEGWQARAKYGKEVKMSDKVPATIPDGYMLVPVEPTPEMITAACCLSTVSPATGEVNHEQIQEYS